MKNLKGKASIIIPAYNEGANIADNLREAIKTFDDFGCRYEIILMDDGSQDNTKEEARKVSEQYPQVIVKHNLHNYGKGRALKKGFRYCSGEYIIFLDADMELHPAQVQTFFDIMRLDNADVVIGSKLHPNSISNYPWQRWVISWGYFFLIKVMFNLPTHDTQTGIKLFKAEVLRKVFPRVLVKKFAFDLEILVNAHHLGYKIAEAPIVLDAKRKFRRIGLTSIFQTFWDTLAVFYRLKIIKYYDWAH